MQQLYISTGKWMPHIPFAYMPFNVFFFPSIWCGKEEKKFKMYEKGENPNSFTKAGLTTQ